MALESNISASAGTPVVGALCSGSGLGACVAVGGCMAKAGEDRVGEDVVGVDVWLAGGGSALLMSQRLKAEAMACVSVYAAAEALADTCRQTHARQQAGRQAG